VAKHNAQPAAPASGQTDRSDVNFGRERAYQRFGGRVEFERWRDQQYSRQFPADYVTGEVAEALEISREQVLSHAQPVVERLERKL
jgi:hypothetical protein